MTIRVAVNGYGTIGKRVAEAITLQPDMKLVGIAKTRPDYAAKLAVSMGYSLYVPSDRVKEFEKAGIEVSGTIEDMLSKADVVVDATPAGTGAQYKKMYEKYEVRMVFQGGEKPEVAEKSFSTLCNYEDAIGCRSLRVVSCNTTGLARAVCTLSRYFKVRRVEAVIVRRGADPKEVKRGPINAVVLEGKPPSHHAQDLMLVAPWVKAYTIAVVVPTTLMHVHVVTVELEGKPSREEVLEVFASSPRILLAYIDRGVRSTAELIEAARDLGRKRADIPELVVWADTVNVEANRVSWVQAVHQESIVVPENIDAIRAVTSKAHSAMETIKLTDKALGLKTLSNIIG